MRSFWKAGGIGFCLFFYVLTLWGSETDSVTDQILIINAYTEANPWSISMINPVVRMAAEDQKLGLVTEHMNMLMIGDAEGLADFEENMFRELGDRRPKVVVLLGTGSYILYEDLNRKWPDVPMILCGERDYTGTREDILTGSPLSAEKRIPLEKLQKPYNLTVMPLPQYIEENLQLMKRMIPRMENVLYIGDETYICQQNDYDISRLLEERYPDWNYRFLSAGEMNADSLFSVLGKVDPRTTGVLFSSWFRKKVLADNVLVASNSHRVIGTSPVPLFAFKDIGIEEEGGIVGGYIYSKERYIRHLLNTIREIVDGRPAREIPFYQETKGTPVFNYRSLVQWGLDPRLCPPDTVFYNRPPGFWEKYKYGVFGGIFLSVVFLLMFQNHRLRMQERIRKLQQQEQETSIRYTDVIDTMPILYMYEELIRNESGQVVETRMTDVNRHFEEKFFKREEVVGKKGSEVFPESVPEFLHFMNIVVKEKRSVTFSYYYKEIDTFYDVVLKASPDGRFMNIFCVDSTELHHAQRLLSTTNRKLSMALEVANIVPWKWDLRSHTILCDMNRPIELMGEKEDVKEEQLAVPDSQYFSKIWKGDLEKVKKAYADLIEGRTAKVREEYRVVNKQDGKYRIEWVEAQAAVESRDADGRPLTLVGSSLVITERKKIEEELMSAKDRAEESNRLKSAFLANMSHEIRTPLNAIVGFSGILASTEEEKEKQEYVSIIENNNTLLLQLISDILDLSKIEAGTMEFVYTDFELNKMMTEQENVLRLKLLPEKDVLLSFEPGLPECYLHAERNRLAQLINNLVTNAIKFTDRGSIRFGYKLQADGMLYFYVTDTGCGIPEEQQESIFGRFVKLNNFAQGTGLGLSICRTLAEHMGGRIGVNSKPGEGSTFWFTIPFQAPLKQKWEEEKVEPLRVEEKTLTVLVAEDNGSNYRLIESILKKEYRLLHAWNGREAVELFREHSPQLVLMDINMPEMDGYEATREIRKLSERVPIIAVTAFAYASDEQKAMESGFDAYMAKPINAHQLRTKITSVLQRHILFM